MKTGLKSRRFRNGSGNAANPAGNRAGYMLMEALVYIGVVVVVIGAAYVAMYRCLDHSMVIRRNAEDIAKAVDVGERWRADVRAASAPVRMSQAPGGQALLEIPTPSGDIAYVFEEHRLSRQAPGAPPVELLANVRNSTMSSESRGKVLVWRWDLELQPRTKGAVKSGKVVPLFTFLAVPSQLSRP